MMPIQIASALLLLASTTMAFSVLPSTTMHRQATSLFISKDIADMIDHEFYREHHRKEFDVEWTKENKKILTYHMHEETHTSKFNDDFDVENFRSLAKDRIMAAQNPQGYCADRCLSTGNCDVFEEMFNFNPMEVMDFCRGCVLADDEDEVCNVPDAFYRDIDAYKSSKLRP